jgi:hypothetical protein
LGALAVAAYDRKRTCAACARPGGADGKDGHWQYSVQSHYRADDGRCYVIISGSINGTDVNGKSFYNTETSLYDGQTGDMLADARTTFGKETGMIFDQRCPQTDSNGDHFTSSKVLASWDETVSCINSKLGD